MTRSREVGRVRPLVASDHAGLSALLDRDPVAHCFVASRVAIAGLDPWLLGGQFLGYFDEGALHSALYVGANLIPVETTAQSRASFADVLRRDHRRSSSFIGVDHEVLDLWRLLEPAWGPAREVRECQPLMVLDHEPEGTMDLRVRPAERADVELLFPACIDMFTAEVGVSPIAGGAGPSYRARIAELVDMGRSLVVIEDGIIVFKAEIGSSGGGVCQVQGVWVNPQLRGQGISVPCMRSVAHYARQHIAPVVSLYVNDFNTAARKAYLSAGFTQRGCFATVLF